MQRRKQILNLQINQLMDGIILLVAFWLAHALRYYGTVYFNLKSSIGPFSDFFWLAALSIPFVPMLLELQGFYALTLERTLWRSLVKMLRTLAWLILFLGICVLFFRFAYPPRSVLILFVLFAGFGILVREHVVLWRLRRRAKNEDLREVIILAGAEKEIAKLEKSFSKEMRSQFRIAERLDIENQSMQALEDALHEHSAERVIFAGGHSQLSLIEQAIHVCETEGVEAWLVADFVRTSIARPEFDTLGSRPMLVFSSTPQVSWALFLKSVMDRCGAFLGLLFLLPLLILVSIAIKICTPGPVFFSQMRSGRRGRPFRMWKFRTMVVDAEERKAELETLNQMSGPVFKVENDPRITKLGKCLRKTSIDELPQLFNVLLGHMSLVGPRPLPVYEIEKIEQSSQRRRLSMKPGLTCLWQVSGRNEVRDFEDWVKLDLAYIDQWSLWLDIKILLRTIPIVIFGFGAK